MDKVQLNLSFHNLSSMIENLRIFNKTSGRYSIISPLKLNDKRAIYLVKDNAQSASAGEPILKVLKFLLQVNTTDEQIRIYRFYESIDHPNFCKIEGIEEIDRFIMIVQEHINGLTLQEYFQTELNKAQKYRILFDLIFALDYIHEFSIVHGDIKPDNIIVRTGNPDLLGTPVIIDFDLGKDLSVSKLRSTKRPFGTNLYMSPEMINSQIYDFKTDIWSLGMTLYSCIVPSRIIQYDLHHVLTYEKTTSPSPTSPSKTLPKSPSYASNITALISNSPKRASLTRSRRGDSYSCRSPSNSPIKNSPTPRGRRMSKIDYRIGSPSDLDDIGSSPINRDRDESTSGSFKTISFSTTMIGGVYDFDHMVHQLDKNKQIIQQEYGNLFYNTIRVMLLKDYNRRPSAHRLKTVIMRSKYYLKLYPQRDNGQNQTASLSSDSDSESYSAEIFESSPDNASTSPNEDTTIGPIIAVGGSSQSADDNSENNSENNSEDKDMRISASNPDILDNQRFNSTAVQTSKSMTNISDRYNENLDNSEEIIHEIDKHAYIINMNRENKKLRTGRKSGSKRRRHREQVRTLPSNYKGRSSKLSRSKSRAAANSKNRSNTKLNKLRRMRERVDLDLDIQTSNSSSS
jgi:serine/threonine protein kinase